MSNLTIEAGKFYKTRGGSKVIVYEVIPEANRVVGALLIVNDRQCHHWFLMSGRYTVDIGAHGLDLVAPWIDPPVVDWSKFPTHIVAMAMDDDGEWHAFTFVPGQGQDTWDIGVNRFCYFPLHREECPVFSGDWRDSLVVRPGWEEGKE